jgi:hypothetical protein
MTKAYLKSTLSNIFLLELELWDDWPAEFRDRRNYPGPLRSAQLKVRRDRKRKQLVLDRTQAASWVHAFAESGVDGLPFPTHEQILPNPAGGRCKCYREWPVGWIHLEWPAGTHASHRKTTDAPKSSYPARGLPARHRSGLRQKTMANPKPVSPWRHERG